MWWIPRGFCILESKSLKVSCNVLGLEDFLTFGCWILLWPWLRLVLGIVLKRLITLISLHPGLDNFPTPLMLSLLKFWQLQCFVDRCLSFFPFPFGHYVVCPSSIYGFWLPLWYLPTFYIIFFSSKNCAFTVTEIVQTRTYWRIRILSP